MGRRRARRRAGRHRGGGGCGAAGRATLLIERYGFLGGMGTAAGVTNFCGLHANVHGEIARVVQGVADRPARAHATALDGLNAPHLIFGQASMRRPTTSSAYKFAADELLAGAQGRTSSSMRSPPAW